MSAPKTDAPKTSALKTNAFSVGSPSVATFGALGGDVGASAGGKGGTLARLYRAGYPVPNGFVVLPAAFDGLALRPEAWEQARRLLEQLRAAAHAARSHAGSLPADAPAAGGAAGVPFAVRSSAPGEDSRQASFAGAFETVLDVRSDEEVRQAIEAVRASGRSERVQAYSQAKGLEAVAAEDLAVVVQLLVWPELAGVLFGVDPLNQDTGVMVGNYVHGLGDRLVSGEVNPIPFTLARAGGAYDGPAELRPYAAQLHELALRLERDCGGPQDLEWAVSAGSVFLLQSRPVTTAGGQAGPTEPDPLMGVWNHSLDGDYLWSCTNSMEALPEVVTPSTWSLWTILHRDTLPVQALRRHPFAGLIGGRAYFNVSLYYWLFRLTMKPAAARCEVERLLGGLPSGLGIPDVHLPRPGGVGLLQDAAAWEWQWRALNRGLPAYLAANPRWCVAAEERIRGAAGPAELAETWQHELEPHLRRSFRTLRAVMEPYLAAAGRLSERLATLDDPDAMALMGSAMAGGGELASLGPMEGLARVARGEMHRDDYLQAYGHRGNLELELSWPRPSEQPGWLDRQLEQAQAVAGGASERIAGQRAAAGRLLADLERRHPGAATALRRDWQAVARRTRAREALRAEVTRVVAVVRRYLLRAGQLTGLGEGVFFLSLDETAFSLRGSREPARRIPQRRRMYARLRALPPPPAFVRGSYDPFAERGSPGPADETGVLTGVGAAAGRAEGLVRVIEGPEHGDQLQPGEVLVTTTTNVGWTPLFLRASAIVTDVGALLSHAAIVARELGVPAVLGCLDATARLRTGDRVAVDGERGVVTILKRREPRR